MGKNAKQKKSRKAAPKPLRLDLGCGPNKQPGFAGVDIRKLEGVDHVVDLRKTPWQWQDNSVDEVHCAHFVEHLTGLERIGFFNELYRVLKPGAKATIITPDWSHSCAYGDPTHQWPPMSGWYPLYLNKQWRDVNAPHVPYTCDFDWGVAASWDAWLQTRPQEMKEFAMQRYVNSMRDLIVNLVKTERPKE
jgi:predicted SAM-dependent methyltransferase